MKVSASLAISFLALAVAFMGCGGSVDSGEVTQGTWCCTDDALEPSTSEQTLTCYLTADDAAAWTLGTCADTKLPDDIPLHPGDTP